MPGANLLQEISKVLARTLARSVRPGAALRPLLGFPPLLRQAGFAVSVDRTIGWITAIGLLGPTEIGDLHRAGLALFAIPPERRAEYDALFAAYFAGDVAAGAEGPARDADEATAVEAAGTLREDQAGEPDETGREASAAERLGAARLGAATDAEALAAFARALPRALPRRLTRRRQADRHGQRIDLRRTLRTAVRRGGEALELKRQRRQTRQRRVLLLIDVSGSMQGLQEPALRLARVLALRAERADIFTLGTRLTRVTPALKGPQEEAAIARAGALIADWEGGTRLGPALQAFLAVPRWGALARGAVVAILSDGLERGDPAELTDAVARLGRRAHTLGWLSPLAGPGYRPETAAMAQVAPLVGRIAPARDLAGIAGSLLDLARRR